MTGTSPLSSTLLLQWLVEWVGSMTGASPVMPPIEPLYEFVGVHEACPCHAPTANSLLLHH